jgi:hypothetical protein
MKKYSLLLTIIFIFAIGSSLQQISAQEKTKEDQDKEQRIQQAIELQKKAMTDKKKSTAEAGQSLKDQRKAFAEAADSLRDQESDLDEDMKDIQVEVHTLDEGGGNHRIIGRNGKRAFGFDMPFTFSPGADSFFDISGDGNSERTTWEFSKSVKENSFSKDYLFDVEKTVNTVVMSINGDCKSGEIRVNIVMPNGKNYSDIVIDEFGNLNWRKSFTISETENQDKAGEWKFRITSTKATGYFKISLHTY